MISTNMVKSIILLKEAIDQLPNLQKDLQVSVSATSISHKQLEKLSIAAPVVPRVGLLHHGSTNCRVAHSLSTSCIRRRQPARRRAIRMEEAAIVTPTPLTGEAGVIFCLF